MSSAPQLAALRALAQSDWSLLSSASVSERAEAANERLEHETRSLRAVLEAQTRLADEKLNMEIRERAELQLQVRLAERDESQEKTSLDKLSDQVHQLQQVLQVTRQTQDEIISSVEVAGRADEATARLAR